MAQQLTLIGIPEPQYFKPLPASCPGPAVAILDARELYESGDVLSYAPPACVPGPCSMIALDRVRLELRYCSKLAGRRGRFDRRQEWEATYARTFCRDRR